MVFFRFLKGLTLPWLRHQTLPGTHFYNGLKRPPSQKNDQKKRLHRTNYSDVGICTSPQWLDLRSSGILCSIFPNLWDSDLWIRLHLLAPTSEGWIRCFDPDFLKPSGANFWNWCGFWKVRGSQSIDFLSGGNWFYGNWLQ